VFTDVVNPLKLKYGMNTVPAPLMWSVVSGTVAGKAADTAL
jgi:hypothetical protein